MSAPAGSSDSEGLRGEVFFVIGWGAWLGLIAGAAVAAHATLTNGYIGRGLTLNATRVAAEAVLRETLVALAVLAAARATLRLLRLLPQPGLRLAALASCAALGFAATRFLGLQDDWWIAGWEIWAAGALFLLAALGELGRLPRPAPVSVAVPAAVLALLLAADARITAERRAELEPRPNIVLLLVDALRPDHMGLFGYARDTTPTIDALAAEGVWYSRALSPSNKTRTAMPSVWTGLYPSRHGVFTVSDLFSPSFDTAAELLRERGYRTAAFCPNPNLDRTVGLHQGWDRYDDRSLRPNRVRGPKWLKFETATRIHRGLLEWIDRNPEAPFLAWLHYRDVHGPYAPPPPYDTMFRSARSRPLSAEEIEARTPYLALDDDGDDLGRYFDQYDGEIRYTDDRIAELLEELERRGLRERTLFVVTADHGEAFLDHGLWNHGGSLYEEEIHVPLVAAGAGIGRGRIDRPVSTLDLFPTLLELGGAAVPVNDGRSLVPDLTGDGRPADGRLVYSEGAGPQRQRQWAVRDGDWKLIVDDQRGTIELFDLGNDPGELIDLSGDRPEVLEGLLAALRRFIDEVGSTMPRQLEPADPELRKRLEALGYL